MTWRNAEWHVGTHHSSSISTASAERTRGSSLKRAALLSPACSKALAELTLQATGLARPLSSASSSVQDVWEASGQSTVLRRGGVPSKLSPGVTSQLHGASLGFRKYMLANQAIYENTEQE